MILYYTGTADYVKPVDTCLWTYLMLNESQCPPKFFSSQFKQECDHFLLDRFGVTQQDITHSNFKQMYLEICQSCHEWINNYHKYIYYTKILL